MCIQNTKHFFHFFTYNTYNSGKTSSFSRGHNMFEGVPAVCLEIRGARLGILETCSGYSQRVYGEVFAVCWKEGYPHRVCGLSITCLGSTHSVFSGLIVACLEVSATYL